MKTIWKFPLELITEQNVLMPLRARILSVGMQAERAGPRINRLCMWAMVDEKVAATYREIRIYGTGHPLPPDPGEFLGTVLDGPFVWHVFDGGETR